MWIWIIILNENALNFKFSCKSAAHSTIYLYPPRTSVFSLSKLHAHKIAIQCPVSKLRLCLRTVETGH